ncbi:MAG: SH3 domain-containing protein [Pseudomonadota bacterium]
MLAGVLLALPVRADVLPLLARVADLSGDVLNVRDGAGAGFDDIGDLRRGTRVEVVGYNADRSWAQIIWQDGNGWVAARFLTPFDPPQLASGLPVGLSCTGAEPFWSLTLSDTGRLRFASPAMTADTDIVWSAPSRNEGNLRYGLTSAGISGVLARNQCIAAGTGQIRGWTLDLIVPGQTPTLLSGCCMAN